MAEPTDAQDPATDAGAAPQPDNADHLSEYSTETGDAAAAAPARPVARKPVVTGNAMGTGRRKEAIARVPRMPVRALVFQLVAAERDLVRVDDDHEITGVHVRREDRLVLAAQQDRRLAGQAAKHDVGSIDNVPLPLDVAGFRAEGAHGGRPSCEY